MGEGIRQIFSNRACSDGLPLSAGGWQDVEWHYNLNIQRLSSIAFNGQRDGSQCERLSGDAARRKVTQTGLIVICAPLAIRR